jgi:tetratricopeptide (TPR) repeat protein
VKNMKMNKLVALFIIAIIVSPNLTIVRGQTLTLAPFNAGYEPGDDISISGTAPATANLTLVIVFNSTILIEANFTAKADGNYSEEYEIPDNATEGVYTVTVSDEGESVDADFTVASDAGDDSRELAETLIEQAEDAKDNVEDAFDDLEDEGVGVPSEVNSSYLQGIEYMDMAKEIFDVGNFTGASEMAFEAIQLLGDALEGALSLQPQEEPAAGVEDDQTGVEGDHDGPQGLNGIRVALERANRYWNNLDEAVMRLEEETDQDVSSIRIALTEAKGALEDAEAHAVLESFTEAREAFTRARKVLGRINGLLNSSVKDRAEKQAEKFLIQFQRRVAKISGTVTGLQGNLAANKTRKVKDVLESTAETLLNISDSLEGGNLTDVVDDLDDVVEGLDDGLDELNGEGLSKQIKAVYRFEAKVVSLNGSLQRLANAGYNTSGLDDYLSEAEGLLSLIEEKIREGDEGAVEELLEEVGGLIEEAQELFKRLQKAGERASRVTTNGRGRSVNPGMENTDDDEEDNITVASMVGLDSDEIAGELRELMGTISQIEETLANISTTGVNTTDVEVLIVEAKALIEDAKALAEENPDEAKELTEVVEELLDNAMDLLEGTTEAESNMSVVAFEPDDDDDEKDEGDEDSSNPELPDEQPDDVGSLG